jgi:hypothetical protein
MTGAPVDNQQFQQTVAAAAAGDPQAETQLVAATALHSYQLGDSSSVNQLAQTMGTSPAEVVNIAQQAMQNDPQAEARLAAATALQSRPENSAINQIAEALRKPPEEVRNVAQQASIGSIAAGATFINAVKQVRKSAPPPARQIASRPKPAAPPLFHIRRKEEPKAPVAPKAPIKAQNLHKEGTDGQPEDLSDLIAAANAIGEGENEQKYFSLEDQLIDGKAKANPETKSLSEVLAGEAPGQTPTNSHEALANAHVNYGLIRALLQDGKSFQAKQAFESMEKSFDLLNNSPESVVIAQAYADLFTHYSLPEQSQKAVAVVSALPGRQAQPQAPAQTPAESGLSLIAELGPQAQPGTPNLGSLNAALNRKPGPNPQDDEQPKK